MTTEQEPSLTPSAEVAVTTENVIGQLQSLGTEAQGAFYTDWLDKTVPGRITATTREAVRAAEIGDKESERALVMEAYLGLELAKDYADRETQGELTAEELAIKEALATLFPDKWPFAQTK